MKIKFGFIALLLSVFSLCPATVFAVETVKEGGSSILLLLFVGFFALIVVFQLVPALLLFGGMLKGLFIPKDTVVKSSNVKS